jgi:hypothetical protein
MNPWDRRVATMRGALAPMMDLCGRWEGEGQAHGSPISSILIIQPAFDATMLMLTERTGEHEDLCYYRWDPDEGAFRVLHLMVASVREYPVEATGEGFIWVTPPSEPSVEWLRRGEGLRQEILWPDSEEPEVWLEYRRVDAR